jgi:hypothetical protein
MTTTKLDPGALKKVVGTSGGVARIPVKLLTTTS